MSRGAVILWGAIACTTAVAGHAAGWTPQKNIEIVVGTAPGSGVDRPARIIQNILEDKRLIDATVTVVNKPGAGGAIAYTYIRQRPGDAHSVVLASPTLVTNHITGKSTLHHSDLTALALLASEYVSFAVRNDSPIRTAQDLRDALKRDPKSLAIGIGTSVGNNNHMAIAQFAKYIGADVAQLKAVAFRARRSHHGVDGRAPRRHGAGCVEYRFTSARRISSATVCFAAVPMVTVSL